MMHYVTRLLFLVPVLAGIAIAEERVPADLIQLPDSVKSVFIAETENARFHVFENEPTAGIRHRGETYMSIGENGVDKQRSGDRRTPLGIYFVTDQLDTTRMHEKYGYTAFVLDYPNGLDRQAGRTGGGIWVHGVDRRGGQRPRLDTDGCIALSNEALADLEHRFEPNRTPVLISREIRWTTADRVDALRRELESAVGRWVESRRRGDLYTFLSLYDEEFRHWGMNKQEWIAFQSETLAARDLQAIGISDLLLLADPAAPETYLSRFLMQSRDSGNAVVLTKRLYWRRGTDGELRLVAEDSG